MAMKCEKENLVSSSMMLVNNPVSETTSAYYPESHYSNREGADSYSYAYHENYSQSLGPFSFGTYQPYAYKPSGQMMHSPPPPNCLCRVNLPVQETFLHQILQGKGYKNDKLFISPRPVIKREPGYHEYGCCYGNQMYTEYPTMMNGFVSKNRFQFQGLSSSH